MQTYVMGDPQAAFATVMAVLEAHGLIAASSDLRDDVQLISIGDHFDYDVDDWATAGAEGLRTLRWLVAQDNATILAGNHDLARVQELALVDDATFAAARALARDIARSPDRATAKAREAAEFRTRFPTLPTPGLAARDYASFTVEQRDLVTALLASGRMRLATTVQLGDRPVLVTHAGVTARELAFLGEPARDPQLIAGILNDFLTAAVARGTTPLDLAPLHVAGGPGGEEGGGLLYHRPSNPHRAGAPDAWAWNAERPRRFDPRELPRGLAQIAGHSGHHKCLEELGAWSTAAARARPRGGLRTLTWDGEQVTYDLGIAPPDPMAAQLYLIDGEMRRVPATDFQLLEADTTSPPVEEPARR